MVSKGVISRFFAPPKKAPSFLLLEVSGSLNGSVRFSNASTAVPHLIRIIHTFRFACAIYSMPGRLNFFRVFSLKKMV